MSAQPFHQNPSQFTEIEDLDFQIKNERKKKWSVSCSLCVCACVCARVCKLTSQFGFCVPFKRGGKEIHVKSIMLFLHKNIGI